MFMEDAAHFLDRGRLIQTGMVTAHNELGFHIIHVGALIGNQAVLALVVIAFSLNRDDRVRFDAPPHVLPLKCQCGRYSKY